jgi:hypothetical protein
LFNHLKNLAQVVTKKINHTHITRKDSCGSGGRSKAQAFAAETPSESIGKSRKKAFFA